jgi:hypothetical protein
MLNLSRLLHAQENERTIFFLRRHWLTVLPLIIGFIFATILPFAVYAVIRYRTPDFFLDPSRFALFILAASMFFLFAWLFLFQNFIDWYLDMWIVTDRRIVNVEQHGLFGRTVSELMLYNVQDVTSQIQGFVRTMVDYGDIEIQTSGERVRFTFDSIPHPNHIAKRILELAAGQRSQS